MSLPQNLGRLSAALTSDASLNIGVGVTPSGSFKLEVGTTSKFTGVATFGSTLSNGTYSYTLPGATGTLALTSDLSGYVTLATSQTISGEKTFSAIRTNINGALVVKSGAATGVIIESFTANYLSLGVTSGVTTYTQNLIFPASSANSYTFPSATGTLALTSALSSYLPLSGGTLTGAAIWNTTGIATDFQNTSYLRFSNSGGATRWGYIQHDGTTFAFANDISGGGFSFNKVISATGASLTGALSGTSATFSGAISLGNNNTFPTGAGIFQGSNFLQIVGGSSGFTINNNANTVSNFIITNAGAATFSSSVTATTGLTVGSLGSGSNAILDFATNASGGPRSIIYRASTAFIDITNTAGTAVFQLSNGGAATFSGRVNGAGGDGNGILIPSNGSPLGLPTTGLSFLTGYNTSYITSYNTTSALAGIYFNAAFLNLSNLGTGTVYSNVGSLTNTNPSDERLKENIKDLSWGLNEILQIKPVSYNWIDDKANQGKQYGFVAQDVQKVLPELVKEFIIPANKELETEELVRLGLDKEAIFVGLVKAIQELKAEIDLLKPIIPTDNNLE